MSEHMPKTSHERAQAHERHEQSSTRERHKSRSEVGSERSGNVSPEDIKRLQQKAEHEARSSKEFASQAPAETPPSASLFGVLDSQTTRTTMTRLRQQLPTYDRAFSRFVHAEPVERVSELASTTIARPSGIFGAGLTAFIGLIFILSVAKRTGFALSGGEFLVLIVVGWCLGLLAEFGYRFARRWRQRHS